jgi:hypothetical protein
VRCNISYKQLPFHKQIMKAGRYLDYQAGLNNEHEREFYTPPFSQVPFQIPLNRCYLKI